MKENKSTGSFHQWQFTEGSSQTGEDKQNHNVWSKIKNIFSVAVNITCAAS